MSTKVQVKPQAKTPAASEPTYARQPPLAMPERRVERPDIATQLEGAARLGHSLGTISIGSNVPAQFKAWPLIQRQPVPEDEDEEEELQLQREPAALQRQENPEEEEDEEELQLKREPAALQRQEDPEEEEEEEIQMKPDMAHVGLEGGPVAPEVEAAIQQARGGGQPLDSVIQAHMGETLGHDFSTVRVHTDAQADALNRQLSARAFTTGRDIFFRRGAYDPRSSSGRELLAHELTHVVQQSTGQVRGSGSGMIIRPAGDTFEQEADEKNKRIEKPGNSPRYQRQVDSLSVGGYPSSTVERSSLRNQVVQRDLLFDPKKGTFTAGGQPVAMDDPRMGGANCHGYTYGTYAISKLNPKQSEDGVGVIVKNEAGGKKEEVKRKKAKFKDKPVVGNLIVVEALSQKYAHSAKVTKVEGRKFSQVYVLDKQGIGGDVNELPLVAKKGLFGKATGIGVSQLSDKNSVVKLYDKTPEAKEATKEG